MLAQNKPCSTPNTFHLTTQLSFATRTQATPLFHAESGISFLWANALPLIGPSCCSWACASAHLQRPHFEMWAWGAGQKCVCDDGWWHSDTRRGHLHSPLPRQQLQASWSLPISWVKTEHTAVLMCNFILDKFDNFTYLKAICNSFPASPL